MALKNICGCASALVLMVGAITTSAVANVVREGRDSGQRHPHIVLRNSDHYARHDAARGPGYAAALPGAGAEWSEAPHLVRVGPNGYWVTSSWGCSIEEAQGRIVDCDSANR